MTATATQTTTTASATDPTVKELLERHARLVKSYDTTSGAPKATVSKRIVDAELELELLGVEDYTAWSKPSQYVQKWTLTESELVERYHRARELADNAAKREVIRDRAEKEAAKLEAQAQKRNIEV